MAKWKEVAQSSEFQSASPSEKLAAKQDYFNTNVVKGDTYKNLSEAQQADIRNRFSTLDPTELIQQDPLSIDSLAGKGADLISGGVADMSRDVGQIIQAFKALPPVKMADTLVGKVADGIQGSVPPGQSNIELWTKNFPRFLAGEVVRQFKPGDALPFLAGAKAAGPLLEGAGKAAWNIVPEGVQKKLTQNLAVGRGAPKEYLAAADEAAKARQAGAQEAQDIGKKLFYAESPLKYTTTNGKVISIKKGQILPQEMQQNIGSLFRGEFDAVETLKAHPQYGEMKTLADEGRAIQDKWSQSLIDSGLPKGEVEQTIKDNIGQYMARMYRTKLVQNDGGIFNLKNLRLRLDGLKRRQELTEDVRTALGEIKEPALPVATRVKEISQSVANESLFKKVAGNAEWSADKNLTGSMIQMPDTATMGSLRKKWVIPEIAGDINSITQLGKPGNDLTSWMIGKYQQGLSAWKFGKVVLNPATHARNMMSNSILLDLSGTSHFDQARLMPKVLEQFINKGPVYQEALKQGAIGGEFMGGDIKAIRDWYTASSGNNMQKLMNIMKVPADKLGDLYQAEEQVFKLVKYTHGIEKGMAPERAAQEAQKWLFDYTKIPEAVKFAKNLAPFITFTYKAVPRVAEALVTNPLRVYKYQALFNGWNEAARKLNGMTPEEYARSEKALPSWTLHAIGGVPANLLMPYRDQYGRDQWMNLEYVLPIGQANDIVDKGLVQGFVSNPVLQLYADLEKNMDFKGQPIVPIASTSSEATRAIANHIYKTVAPSLAPALGDIEGGYSWQKISKALSKQPDYANRLRDLGPVLLDTLGGLKITPIDVQEAESFNMKDRQKTLIDLRKQAMKVMSPAFNPKRRDKELENIFQKMQKVMDE